MNLDIFYRFIKSDSEANNILYELTSNPNFIFELFIILENEKDISLLNGVSMVLVHMVSKIWGIKESILNNSEIDSNYSHQVINKVIQLTYFLSSEIRSHLIECIRIFIEKSSRTSYNIKNELFPLIISAINNNLNDIISTFEIISFFFDDIKRFISNQKEIDEIFIEFLKVLTENQINQLDFNEKLYLYLTKCLIFIIKNGLNVFIDNNFIIYFNLLIQISFIEKFDLINIDLKKNIFEMFTLIISKILSKKSKITKSQIIIDNETIPINFINLFINEIIPEIENSTNLNIKYFLLNRNQMNDQILSLIIKIYYLLTKYQYTNNYLTNEFLINILIPSSMLTNEMILDYFQNPEQYIGFTMNLESNSEYDSVRRSCSYFIMYLRSLKSQPIDLMSLLFNNYENDFDLESRIFLFYEFYRGTNKRAPRSISTQLFSYLINDCNLNEILHFDLESIFDEIQINTNNLLLQISKIFLIPSLLVFLQYSNYNSSEIRDLSYYIFINSLNSNPILKISSATLLGVSLTLSNNLGNIDIKLLLENILNLLSSNTKDTRIGILLQEITKLFDEFSIYGLELVEGLFKSWLLEIDEITDEDSEERKCLQDELIESVVTIIENQNINDLNKFLDICLEFSIDVFINRPNCSSIPNILKLMSIFSKRFESPPIQLLTFIPILISFLNNGDYFPYLINEIVSFLIPLIIKSKDLFKNSELILEIINLCDYFINIDLNNIEITCISSSLIIISTIISSGGNNYLYLIDRPLLIFNKIEPPMDNILFLSCIYVFTSALFISENIYQQIPIEIISQWIESTDIQNAPLIRDMNIWIYGLTILLKFGFNEILNKLIEFLPIYIEIIQKNLKKQNKKIEINNLLNNLEDNEEEDCEFEEEDFDDDLFYAEPLIPNDIILPFEKINILKFVYDTLNSLNLLNQLNFDLIELIKSILI